MAPPNSASTRKFGALIRLRTIYTSYIVSHPLSGARTMKILVLHNDYLQLSGESLSVAAEVEHLRRAGCEVEYIMSKTKDTATRVELARHLVYSPDIKAKVANAIASSQPDIVHVHNLFPWLGNSAISAVASAGLPYVQTLRNYRVSCLSGNHFRENAPCDLCRRSATAWRGVRYGCYRGSSVYSGGVMLHDAVQRSYRFVSKVARPARFIVLSRAMEKQISPAMPDWARLCVKYNSLESDPSLGSGGGGIVFVGRLSAEKGILLLLEAWARLHHRPPLTIVGDGPLAADVRRVHAKSSGLTLVPRLTHHSVLRLIGQADLLAAPALWEEPFGRTVMESLACGTPVLATTLGAAPELVGEAGWICAPEPASLASLLPTALQEAIHLRDAARRRYQTILAPEATTRQLINIYDEVLGL